MSARGGVGIGRGLRFYSNRTGSGQSQRLAWGHRCLKHRRTVQHLWFIGPVLIVARNRASAEAARERTAGVERAATS